RLRRLAVPTGFEPAISALTGRRVGPGYTTGPYAFSRAPNGIRTRASALKGRDPRPLDDGGDPIRPRPGGSAGQYNAAVCYPLQKSLPSKASSPWVPSWPDQGEMVPSFFMFAMVVFNSLVTIAPPRPVKLPLGKPTSRSSPRSATRYAGPPGPTVHGCEGTGSTFSGLSQDANGLTVPS